LSIPPFHWWRTVFFLIPAISVYTIVLGTLSILSTFVDRKGEGRSAGPSQRESSSRV